MLKVTLILDNKFACDMTPNDFVKERYLTKMANDDLKYIEIDQGDEYPELVDSEHELTTTRIVCPYHKQHPDRTWGGCSCRTLTERKKKL